MPPPLSAERSANRGTVREMFTVWIGLVSFSLIVSTLCGGVPVNRGLVGQIGRNAAQHAGSRRRSRDRHSN